VDGLLPALFLILGIIGIPVGAARWVRSNIERRRFLDGAPAEPAVYDEACHVRVANAHADGHRGRLGWSRDPEI
jgi:hypothetical protein